MERDGARVLELREGCKLLGVYNPVGGARAGTPGVMVVETNDPAHLGFITNHYRGLLDYLWMPAMPVATTAAAAAKQMAARR